MVNNNAIYMYLFANKIKSLSRYFVICILLTKITAAQNEAALRYHTVCGLYFLAVIFAETVIRKGL